MSRSKRKGPNIRQKLLKKMQNTDQGTAIPTKYRDCTIIPKMVGFTFLVHNGRKYIPVYVGIEMVGHCLGEFSDTRHFTVHAGDRKSKGG